MNGFEKNGLYYEIIDEKKKTVRVRYAHWTAKPTGALSIPENVENDGKKYTVTEIGGWGAYKCIVHDSVTDKRSKTGYRQVPREIILNWQGFKDTDITSIKMPKTITKIGNNAFRYCKKLTKVEMPPNVVEIGEYAFSECEKLTKVEMSPKIVKIEHCAFSNCTSLTSITLPETVKTLEYGAFANCKKLKSVNIPPLVEVLERDVFARTQIKTIKIPAGVNLIKNDAFASTIFKNDDRYPKEAIIDNSDGNLVIEDGAFPAETKITYKGKSLLSKLFGK